MLTHAHCECLPESVLDDGAQVRWLVRLGQGRDGNTRLPWQTNLEGINSHTQPAHKLVGNLLVDVQAFERRATLAVER